MKKITFLTCFLLFSLFSQAQPVEIEVPCPGEVSPRDIRDIYLGLNVSYNPEWFTVETDQHL